MKPRTHRPRRLPALILGVSVLSAAAGRANTITVDHAAGSDYLTIQAGIDAVIVSPGTYAWAGRRQHTWSEHFVCRS